ncbi:hypothetical protein D9619_012829 [Psilocybe cf. subviscida]|uniref:Poly [ADP-ribose] polymerase n=1 Tax=Psilocybe cf. subviscida TaxID=2480587 RepID=A0A8H5AQD4_9AGAR|nr:hypothetical protein D9619_012829 [Psilocybe cf. subviscida]
MPPRKKATSDAPAAPTRRSTRGAATAAAAPVPNKRPHESDAEDDADDAPVANAKPASKKTKTKAGDVATAGASSSKATKKKTTKKDAPAAGDDDEEADPKPTSKKVKAAAKPVSKMAAAVQDDEDDEDKEDPKMITVIKRGAAPVDPPCGKTTTHQVYATDTEVYDAMLNQTDVSGNANKNKFYVIQLLHTIGNKEGGCLLHTRWGRVGDIGQQQAKGPFPTSTAINEFKKQFKAKAGVNWEDRRGMVPKKGKYTFLERDYNDDEDEEQEKKKKKKDDDDDGAPVPPSSLADEVQDLCKLLFSTSLMDAHLSSMNYDAKKLPLGKLAKSTILGGFAALKSLAEVINDPSGLTATGHGGHRAACEHFSSAYYSIIPHDFGRNRPLVIDNATTLKRELDLVDALGDMEVASKLLKSTIHTDASGNPVNPIDANFRSLGLTSMAPVARSSQEFTNLEKYVHETHGSTHHIRVKVQNIYKVERAGETEAWKKAGYDALPDGDRMLLWHGSRTTNFAGILKQGLRIAPPEAPVSGYMFGKGVYFADMMSKSANYCYAHLSNNTGLLLLCEVAAKPFYELKGSAYDADQQCKKAQKLATKGIGRTAPTEWKDAGRALNNPELVGCDMPAGPGKDLNLGHDVYLQYNEYIVYDPSQIRLKYLLMVNM